jgi:RTA1 like protein
MTLLLSAAAEPGGYAGTIASNELSFMTLEAPMMIIAVLKLTAFHPGRCFDGEWAAAVRSFRAKKVDDVLREVRSSKTTGRLSQISEYLESP